MSLPRLPSDPRTIVLLLQGPIHRDDVPRLCKRVRLLLASSGAMRVVCDVGALNEPDVVTLEALARLKLTTLRLGKEMQLRHPCAELRDLLALAGLGEALPLCTESGVEPRGEPEEREQSPGVEKEGDPGDLAG